MYGSYSKDKNRNKSFHALSGRMRYKIEQAENNNKIKEELIESRKIILQKERKAERMCDLANNDNNSNNNNLDNNLNNTDINNAAEKMRRIEWILKSSNNNNLNNSNNNNNLNNN
eukprot:Tbor_TRINITY_DN5813_c5_g2::TRINITY_DN5813_c5_g2_i1::g.6298::m.6298